MNMYSNDYLKNQIATASKEQLLILFYDGAIRFTRQAKIAIENKNIEGRNYAINKASAIVTELAATLDHSRASEIAADLDALYGYMLKVFNETCIKNNIRELDVVEGILSDLRETWIQAIKISHQKQMYPPGGQEHISLSVAM